MDTGQSGTFYVFLALFGVGCVILISQLLASIPSNDIANLSDKNMLNEKLKLVSRTNAEIDFRSGHFPVNKDQAGFPGNTLPPEKPNKHAAPPAGRHTMFDWKNIPANAGKIYIGARLRGSYQNLKDLAYFPVIQTPPQNKNELYGDMAIFVEGGRIGFRLNPGNNIDLATALFPTQFDFGHNDLYTIEMEICMESNYITRINLLVDGAQTGHSFEMRGSPLKHSLAQLPTYVTLQDNVESAYLQFKPMKKDAWGSIVEVNVNK